MTIRNTFPSDQLRPGFSAEFDLTSASKGLTPTTKRVALIGTKKTAGLATTEVPVQVFNEGDADLQFGSGSELALMCRAAFLTGRGQGTTPQIWGCPMIEPGGGTAATGTIVVTGAATESGNIEFSIAGRRFFAPVANLATPTAAALAIVAAVNAKLAEVPGTVAPAVGTVTYTHAHKGVNGNDVRLVVHSKPAGLTVTPTNPVNGAGVTDISLACTALLTQDYGAVACANHAAADTADFITHLDEAWGMTKKRWRHAYLGERGSLSTATTLAGTANDHRIVVIGYNDSYALPGVIAASVATMVESRDAPNYNHNATLLRAIPSTPVEEESIDTEIQTMLAGGVTPLSLEDGSGVTMLERLVTTKKTIGANPFYDLLDLAHSKTVAYTATQCQIAGERAIAGRNLDDTLMRDVRGRIFGVLKAEEELGYLHRVDAHAAEIRVEADPIAVGRLILEVPTAVVPLAHQIHGVFRLILEVPAAV